MTYKKIDVHPINLEKYKDHIKELCPNEYKNIFDYVRLLQIGEINKGVEITERRAKRVLYNLSLFIPKIKKPVNSWTKEDIRDYIERLQNDKIKKVNGKPFSESTKVDVKIQLKNYLKWRLPNKYNNLSDWISVKLKKKSVDYLKEEEIEKLYNSAPTPEGKFLIAVLFDSGSRIEEFLNIRNEDIIEPTDNFPYYKINFRVEYSKTEGREIGLYWKKSSEAIKNYLSSVIDKEPNKQVFPKDYDAVRLYLTRLGKRVLKKRIHAHLLRKSSATFYAGKLNRQQLCIRYGWKFSSNMPDVYIKRSGLDEGEVKESMVNTNLNQISKENQELKTRIGLIKDNSEKEIASLKANMPDINNMFNLNIELTSKINSLLKVLGKTKEANEFDKILNKIKNEKVLLNKTA